MERKMRYLAIQHPVMAWAIGFSTVWALFGNDLRLCTEYSILEYFFMALTLAAFSIIVLELCTRTYLAHNPIIIIL
jgi:hypothetical protein